MSSTRKLRLGPQPGTTGVKLTFTCPVSLKADPERYAAQQSKLSAKPLMR